MRLSKHAETRSRQRGISYDIVDLILQHGSPEKKPGGATEYKLRKRDKAERISYHKQQIRNLEKAIGKGVLVGNDGEVITIYHERG